MKPEPSKFNAWIKRTKFNLQLVALLLLVLAPFGLFSALAAGMVWLAVGSFGLLAAGMVLTFLAG